ncbi:hypothetical protein Z043_111857, partial [Scleropages formosus]
MLIFGNHNGVGISGLALLTVIFMKLNNSLLKDEYVKVKLKRLITYYCDKAQRDGSVSEEERLRLLELHSKLDDLCRWSFHKVLTEVGLCLNLKKCELLALKDCPATSISGIPVKERINYLGIQISKDSLDRIAVYFNVMIDKTKSKFNLWLQGDLSLKGCIIQSKTEGISRLTYVVSSVDLDSKTARTIDQMLFNFLWKNRIHCVRKSVVVNSCKYEFGLLMKAVPNGSVALLKEVSYPAAVAIANTDTPCGRIGFSRSFRNNNRAVCSLFWNEVASFPYVTAYWNTFLNNVPWEKVWLLTHKYFVTNQVKETSFKIIHKFYPVKHFLRRLKDEIDVNCSFCNLHPEMVPHLFWHCCYTKKLWRDVSNFIIDEMCKGFAVHYEYVLFGFFHFD